MKKDINDLTEDLNCNIKLFADDTYLFGVHVFFL